MPRAILSLLVSVALISGCASSKTTSTSVITEEYAVYEAAIESLYLTEGIELIVIKDHTATDLSPGESLDSVIQYIQENLGPAIESETLDDYRARNRRSQELDKGFSLNVQCVLLSEIEFNEVFERGGGWSQFYATHPNSQGIMTLSRVGFNVQMDQALVYVGNQADYLAGRGYYVLLTKRGGAWAIQSMVVAWIS